MKKIIIRTIFKKCKIQLKATVECTGQEIGKIYSNSIGTSIAFVNSIKNNHPDFKILMK